MVSFHLFANDTSVDHNDAIEAYHQYWQTFEGRQSKILQESLKRNKDILHEKNLQENEEKESTRKEMINRLQKSLKIYSSQIEDYPSGEKYNYALLNLAQVKIMIFELINQNLQEPKYLYYLEEAIDHLEILQKMNSFAKWKYSTFLLATTYSLLGDDKKRTELWSILARTKTNDRYKLYSLIALGDHYFHHENPESAANLYITALKLTRTLNQYNPSYIRYRLLWAYFRSGQMQNVLKTSEVYFYNKNRNINRDENTSIYKDFLDLTSTSLFELSLTQDIKPYFEKDYFGFATCDVTSILLSKIIEATPKELGIQISDKAINDYNFCEAYPQLLNLRYKLFIKLGKMNEAMASLEKLLLILPADSLWKKRHQNNQVLIDNINSLALDAGIRVSNWYYTNGLKLKSKSQLVTSSNFYRTLYNFDPNHKDAQEWLYRIGNAYYYSGHYKDAIVELESMLGANYQNQAILEKTMHRLFYAYESQIRISYHNNFDKDAMNADEHSNSSIELLDKFNNLTKQYATTNNYSHKSMELILAAASLNKDLKKIDSAIEFWNLILSLKSNSYQRRLAIKGIIFSKIRYSTPEETLLAIRNILENENWSTLGTSLKTEVFTLLEKSVVIYKDLLVESNDFSKAAKILYLTAVNYPKLTHADRLLMESGYYFAMADQWSKALETANYYIDQKYNKYLGDIYYLKARSQEYLFLFSQAIVTYEKFAKDFPKHKKSDESLKRAIALADQEELYTKSAELSVYIATKLKSKTQASYLKKSIEYYLEDKDYKNAIQVANILYKQSSSPYTKIESILLKSKAQIHLIKNAELNTKLNTSFQQIQKFRASIKKNQYTSYLNQFHLLKGNLIFDQFKKQLNRPSVSKANSLSAILNNAKKEFDQITDTGLDQSIYEARYKVALMSDQFVEYLENLNSSGMIAGVSISSTKRRWKEISNSYFSKNYMYAADNNLDHYKTNKWLRRSLLKIKGQINNRNKLKSADISDQKLPIIDSPSKWSM